MTIAAEVICDSTTDGRIWKPVRLTTLRLRYPRFIHSEFMTHRVFSRNASSSRAIPVKRKLVSTVQDLAYPLYWGSNLPGMQAGEELPPEVAAQCKAIWEDMAAYCQAGVQKLAELGLHKQWANRPSEWFSHITVLVSSTEWDNFMELRDHPDAQPEIRALAQAMKSVMAESTPRWLTPDDWHLPYVNEDTIEKARSMVSPSAKGSLDVLLVKISVARCARVSYLTHDDKVPLIEDDLKLYERLVGARPLHASPAEHQATPCDPSSDLDEEMTGNFRDWVQYRKILEDEIRT